VREYLVWQIEDERVDWFVLEEGEYLSLSADDEGRLASRVFPGLVMDVEALLAADFAAVLSGVQARAGTDPHQAFVETLGRTDDG
jgi:hypothetical protein